MAPKIIPYFPQHRIYVEPFSGGAGILLQKERAGVNVYNDIDSRAVNFFKVLRDRTMELLFTIAMTPYSREEFCKCIDILNNRNSDDVELARAFYVTSWQSIPRGGCKVTPGNFQVPSPDWPKIECVFGFAEILRHIIIEHLDFEDCIEKYDATGTLFYVDPPYIKQGDRYEYNMTIDDHSRLLSTLRDVDGMVVLSTTYNEMYFDTLWDWEVVNLGAMQTAGVRKGVGVATVEYLLKNF